MSELWRPSPARIADATLTRFTSCVNARRGTQLREYAELYAWSLAEPADFWSELARFADVRADWGAGPAIEHPGRMPGARFFPGARLNFAENLLRFGDDQPALVFRNERGTRRTLSYRELRAQVARVADGLRCAGVVAGDRVAGFLPNLPEAAIAMLAAASVGATWSSCSPDFGVRGVLERFGQIQPKVLFSADGYFYAGKQLDSLQPMSEALAQLTAVERVVVIPYVDPRPDLAALGPAAGRASLWQEFGVSGSAASFAPLPFDHPLYILYSSGTTGSPKCIVHGAGGTLLQHHKEHLLHTVLSTGSPLLPESFDYVYSAVKADLQLASISGGTDIVSCFALGCPTRPVYRGEIQCRGLGMAVDIFDDAGRPVRGERGELVCTAPFPSMPVGFWNDPTGAKYRAAYFERFPGVWCQGDYAALTEHDGVVIYGPSDAVLNPGGVRIGTAEVYAAVESLPQILEALAVAQDWQGDVRIVLFVRLQNGAELDEALQQQIRSTIRTHTNPRHVPAEIIDGTDIPRALSGKVTELAVRNVIHGLPVKNLDALANPEALAHFRALRELGS